MSNRPAKLPFTTAMFTPLVRKLFNLAFIEGLPESTRRPSAAQGSRRYKEWRPHRSLSESSLRDEAFVVPDTHKFICPCAEQLTVIQPTCQSLHCIVLATLRGLTLLTTGLLQFIQTEPIFSYHIDSQKSPEYAVIPSMSHTLN